MPLLDVSVVLDDPMFQDTMTAVRRAESLVKGRTATTDVPVLFNGSADLPVVVTQQSPADLMRKEDGQVVPRRIFLATRVPLRCASKEGGINYQPDVLTWNGTRYLVTEPLPYSRYGAGFYEFVAESMTVTDVVQ